jgi:prevent-host-death family protein
MVIQVNVADAKARLSELIAAAEQGEEVVIARAGSPVVRLSPIVAPKVRRAGIFKEMGWTGAPTAYEAFAPEPEHGQDQPL